MQTVTLIAYTNALLLDIAGPLQVFSSANKILGERQYEIRIASEHGEPVETDTGVKLLADHGFDRAPAIGNTIIPGGHGVNEALQNSNLLAYLKQATCNQKRVISVCSGSILLAATGLLNGKQATCHWSRCNQVSEQYPDVRWNLNKIFIKDGNVYTSAGVSTGIDLCLSILEEDWGREVTLKVARELVLFMQRTGNQSQYSRPLMMQATATPNIRQLCASIMDDPAKNWRVSDMAELANMTERTLHRHFTSSFQQSPSQYVEQIRLDHARKLFDDGEKSTKKIARISGFGSEQTLRRAFVNNLDVTPSEYKKRFGNT